MLIKSNQLNNQIAHFISWMIFSHDTFFELHLGHFLRFFTSLSLMSKAGTQPVQHDNDLPRLCMALPAFSSWSVLPKYQALPQDWQVHLVSRICLFSFWVLILPMCFACASLSPLISRLNHLIGPINLYLIIFNTKPRPSWRSFDHPYPFRSMTLGRVAEHGVQYLPRVFDAMP